MNMIIGDAVKLCSIILLLVLLPEIGTEGAPAKNVLDNNKGRNNSGTEMITKVPTKAFRVERISKKVISCDDHIESTYKSLPGPPTDLQTKEYFNKRTHRLSLDVTWKSPVDETSSTLWGFQVHLIRLGGYGSSCYQINRTNTSDMHFQFNDSIQFNTKYKIVVASLPRSNNSLEDAAHFDVETPEKCKLLREHGITLPLEDPRCDLVPNQGDNVPFGCYTLNVSVEENGCHNGSTRVTWDKPNLNICIGYKYLVEWKLPVKEKWQWYLINPSQNGTDLSHLKKDAKYIVKVRMRTDRNSDGDWVISKSVTRMFSCKDPSRITPTSTKQIRLVLYVIVTSCLVLFVTGSLFLLLCFKIKQQQRRSASSNNNGDNAPTTMLLYCSGCDRVRDFVLLLASVLNANGILVFADVLESNLIAEIGAAAYHEKREEESDFVIIVCTEDTDTSSLPCHTAFNFLLNIIRHNVMTEAKIFKYIPIYMDSKKKGISVVPNFLQSVGLKFPDSFEDIIQRILAIRPCELRNSTSAALVEHVLHLDQTTLHPLKTCISNILRPKHPECVSRRCSKGLKSSPVSVSQIDQISMDYGSLQRCPTSEVNEIGACQLDMSEIGDDPSSFEFRREVDNGLLNVDSRVTVV